MLPGNILQANHSAFHFSEEFDTGPSATSFALSHLRQHGMPYTLIVDRGGRIRSADRRPGWRALVGAMPAQRPNRLPDRITRAIERHAGCPPDTGVTVLLVERDVIVSLVSLEGEPDVVACSLWQIGRDRVIDQARRCFTLTNRECELLDRILHGNSSAEIARTLCIALATVEWHTKRLLIKTDTQNRTQMTAKVLGWMPDIS